MVSTPPTKMSVPDDDEDNDEDIEISGQGDDVTTVRGKGNQTRSYSTPLKMHLIVRAVKSAG